MGEIRNCERDQNARNIFAVPHLFGEDVSDKLRIFDLHLILTFLSEILIFLHIFQESQGLGMLVLWVSKHQ